MWTCEVCGEEIADTFDSCWKCAGEAAGDSEGRARVHDEVRLEIDIPIVTTEELPGQVIRSSLSVVCGEAMTAANLLADLSAGITSVIGGATPAYRRQLELTRCEAYRVLARRARARGANAVVATRVDYEHVGGGIMMVAVSGTAVCVEPAGA